MGGVDFFPANMGIEKGVEMRPATRLRLEREFNGIRLS
jgi:hypothetical protein